MNFPGLDPLWSGAHHLGHGIGAIRTWSIEECRAALGKGDKVLVVATTALGDSLLTTPLLSTLAHHLGPERVSLLTKEPYADLYQGDPRLHRIFTVRGKYRWNELERELRADPHAIALLANITEPDLVPELWHAGVRGFLRYRSRWTRYPRWMANGDMLRRPGGTDYASGHAIENNLAMAEALGFSVSTHRLEMPKFAVKNRDRVNTILIHPGASRANKRWPVENWARVANELATRFDMRVSLTGDRSERSLIDEILGGVNSKKINGAGMTPLPVLARMLASSTAFISGDTGPYHLALAVGCPTVTLFAPTDRGSSVEACGPHAVDPVFHRAIETETYGDSIVAISVEHVLAEASDVIGKSLAQREAP